MNKTELQERIKRNLGYPMVRVELNDDQINDSIDDALFEFKRWSLGVGTQEVYFTELLSSGEAIYDLPDGVVSVIDYETETRTSGINTLFTVENYLWNQGMLDAFKYSGSSTGMVQYHMALDFLNTLDRYTTSKYTFRYHPYRNQIQITPTPSGNDILIERDDGTTFYSPGFILLRTYMLTGSSLGSEWSIDDWYSYVYTIKWVQDYATARAKEKLGYIRRKFSNFDSIGNSGISLDGSDLISEAKEEQQQLMEQLKLDEYSSEGFGIDVG